MCNYSNKKGGRPRISAEEKLHNTFHRVETLQYKEYCEIGKSFKKLDKKEQQYLTKHYNVIISNQTNRDLVFWGAYCKMTPKEFFTIWHLLHNGSFLYDYYEHATYKKRGREYNKYHDKYKVVTKETKNFKSGDKQLIDIKNKIKNKIRKSLDENKINVKNFEKEFDAFIQIKHWYTEPLSKNDCILKTHYIKNISLCSDEDYVKFIKNYCLNPIID